MSEGGKIVPASSLLAHGFLLRLALSPLGLLYRIWLLTLRMETVSSDEDSDLHDVSEPTIIVLWHNRLFGVGECIRRYRKARTCYGLISGSRDGAWLESFYRWSGLRAVRGSRNKRGAGALRDLARLLRSGCDVGITPDGSRGPCYEAKPGALLLAKVSKSPILLLSFEFGSAWRLNSWDEFYVPKPFSKIVVRGKKIAAEELFAEHTPEEAAKVVEEELMKLTKD
ncbi:MAG: lysophospholipid acyltransferase family protein [Verrucomicrobia bacterium]|nr:lysophospholipid acyltransferase family protein [Verrucomicrobiota bacterium]